VRWLREDERERERDGERWREMERDGERWREREREGEIGRKNLSYKNRILLLKAYNSHVLNAYNSIIS